MKDIKYIKISDGAISELDYSLINTSIMTLNENLNFSSANYNNDRLYIPTWYIEFDLNLAPLEQQVSNFFINDGYYLVHYRGNEFPSKRLYKNYIFSCFGIAYSKDEIK